MSNTCSKCGRTLGADDQCFFCNSHNSTQNDSSEENGTSEFSNEPIDSDIPPGSDNSESVNSSTEPLVEEQLDVADIFLEENDDEDVFKDLDISNILPLSVDRNRVFNYPDTVDKICHLLRIERIVFLDCASEDILYDLMNEIRRDSFYSAKNANFYTFGSNSAVEDSVSSFKRFLIDKLKESLLIIDAPFREAKAFLQSLCLESRLILDYYKKVAADLDMYVLILSKPSLVKDFLQNSSIQHFHIDFLEPLLQRKFINETDPDSSTTLIKKLLEQKQLGYWEEDEEAFHDEIKSLLFSDSLENVIIAREENNEQLLKSKKSDVITFLQNASTIQIYALFVASYFPNLNVIEFDKVMETLLGDLKDEPNILNEIGEDGLIVESNATTRYLRDIWHKSKRNILEECRLLVRKPENSPSIVSRIPTIFIEHSYRKSIIDMLEEDYYHVLHDLYNDVQENLLIFNDKRGISRGAHDLFLEMAKIDTELYGKISVISLINSIMVTFEPNVSVKYRKFFISVHVSESSQQRIALNRVAELLSEMLTDIRLEAIVKNVLKVYMQRSSHQLVFSLLRRIQGLKKSDLESWIKRLLSEGSMEIKLQVLNYLIYLTNKDHINTEFVFEMIEPWIGNDSNMAKYAFSIIIALSSQFVVSGKQKYSPIEHILQHSKFRKMLINNILSREMTIVNPFGVGKVVSVFISSFRLHAYVASVIEKNMGKFNSELQGIWNRDLNEIKTYYPAKNNDAILIEMLQVAIVLGLIFHIKEDNVNDKFSDDIVKCIKDNYSEIQIGRMQLLVLFLEEIVVQTISVIFEEICFLSEEEDIKQLNDSIELLKGKQLIVQKLHRELALQ